MLSICIPTYNFDVSRLIQSLIDIKQNLENPIEIIVIDDASEFDFRKRLKETLPTEIKFFQLQENIGRARIRNLFLKHAQYEHLLFLDSDVYVIHENFIKNYLEEIIAFPNQVICGGRNYPKQIDDNNRLLSWKYGIKSESKSASQRALFPYNSFMTNNFIIAKSIFFKIRFDERIFGYGHEDTLYGISLKKRGIPIKHIENPVLNGDIEINSIFLNKTEQGIQNLIQILKFTNYNSEVIASIKLLKFYFKIKKLSLLLSILFVVFKPLIKRNLNSSHPFISLFDFYKLGLLNSYFKRMK